MQKPVELDLTIYRNADFTQTFRLEQSNGSPVNLTGAIVIAQIRQAARDTAPLIVAFTVSMPAPSTGEFTLSLTDTQTAAVTKARGYYDVLISDSAGIDAVYVEGRITFNNTVSKKL